jgi:hypothetical protein
MKTAQLDCGGIEHATCGLLVKRSTMLYDLLQYSHPKYELLCILIGRATHHISAHIRRVAKKQDGGTKTTIF